MSDIVKLNTDASNVLVSPEFGSYSKVVIHINDETQVVAGNDSGLVLEFDNPFGTQSMADRILASLNGFRYSPYTANGAILDPAAEIGDAAQTATSYGGIYSRNRRFGALMKADISAPCDEEVDHEFKFETPTERKFKRTVGEVRASISLTNEKIELEVEERKSENNILASRITQTSNAITAEVTRATEAEGSLSSQLNLQADSISAKVSATGGNGSFSWVLTADSHTWKAGGNEVMKVSATGLVVRGEIQATKGTIGGFTIGANAIYKSLQIFGGTAETGVYLGTNGIQLGQAFKVTSGGQVTATNISANNMTLTGTLNIGGTAITADALRGGAQSAYTNGGTWSTGAGYGYSYNAAAQQNSGNYPSYFTCGNLYHKGQYMTINGQVCQLLTKTINGTTIHYLGYA